VRTGALVRVSAIHFQDVARELFGVSWKSKLFYGKICGRVRNTPGTFDI
jgi:hypothetical protein